MSDDQQLSQEERREKARDHNRSLAEVVDHFRKEATLALSAIEATPSGRGSRSEQYAEMFAKVGLDAEEASRLRRDAADPDRVKEIAAEFTTLYRDFRQPDPWAWLETSVAGLARTGEAQQIAAESRLEGQPQFLRDLISYGGRLRQGQGAAFAAHYRRSGGVAPEMVVTAGAALALSIGLALGGGLWILPALPIGALALYAGTLSVKDGWSSIVTAGRALRSAQTSLRGQRETLLGYFRPHVSGSGAERRAVEPRRSSS